MLSIGDKLLCDTIHFMWSSIVREIVNSTIALIIKVEPHVGCRSRMLSIMWDKTL